MHVFMSFMGRVMMSQCNPIICILFHINSELAFVYV